MLSAAFALLYYLNGASDSSYILVIDGAEANADSMSSLAADIAQLEQPVSVDIYSSENTLLETLKVDSEEMAAISDSEMDKLGYDNDCKRLKMYVEPSLVDLIARKICIKKEVFDILAHDAFMFDLESLKESYKPVFDR
jgi:hypothetical protein